ncbi:MAG: ABC transporter substrate-binding protein [Deinococcota bacterium]
MKLFIINKLILVCLSALFVSTTALAQYNEAPMLAELVAAGELPPVEERLPANPRVFPVFEEIGTYGGTLRRAYKGASDRWGPTKLLEERIVEMVQLDPDTIELVPGYVDDFVISEDASEFTFTLMEGLKWSDGAPITTRDVQFWYEDIFLNGELTPNISELYTVDSEVMTVEIMDERTFTVKFVGPYPLFPEILAKESTGAPGLDRPGFIQPFHYLQDFHPTYAEADALQASIEQYGAEDWTGLWDSNGAIQAWWFNPDLPVITPWRIAVPPPADIVVMERNPYYYGVDAEGNQLPYIDFIEHRFFEANEAFNLMIIQGEIDAQARHVNAGDFTLYKENEANGNYRVVTWRGAGTTSLFPNYNVQDDVLANLYEDMRFREALNIAIDRIAINELVFSGLAEPRQASPISGSPYFDADYEQQWVEYSPDRANELLNDMGLTERDGDGFRLRSDGERLSIVVESRSESDALELISAYWADIGIEALIRVMERSLFEERRANNEQDMYFGGLDRSSVVSADPRRYLGWETGLNEFYKWYNSAGENGIEPPANHPIRDAWAAWDSAKSAASIEDARAAVQDLISVNRDNNWYIGIVGEEPSIYIVNSDLRNFPSGFTSDDAVRSPGNGVPHQWFFAN